MDYPFWDTPVAYGPLMAFIAVLHVFVSHFAIGGGLYLVVAERGARKRADLQHLDFLKRLSRFFVLVTLVFGALSGVAIWFVIGLLSPMGTEALIHNFVWGWAIEWTFFIVEILAAMLYLFGWERLSPRRHMALGWIYFGAAWLSLVVINGIVTFMLTPGDWLATGGFWDGFFNPTYLPSLVLRTGICGLLAGAFVIFVAAGHPDAASRRRIVRGAARWGLAGLAVTALGRWMYDRVDVLRLDSFRETVERLVMPDQALVWMTVGFGVLGAGLLCALLLPSAARRPVGVVLLLAGLLGFGGFEWYRESARKPFVIQGFMYGNGVRADITEEERKVGLLERVPYRTGDDGRDLFNYSCRSCHTLDGYRSLRRIFEGTDPSYITGALRGLHVMRAPMPPFVGSEEERQALGAWLAARVDTRPLHEIHGLSGAALGQQVYDVRCGMCHVPGGFGDITGTLAGMEAEDIDSLLSDPDMAEEMPMFTGDAQERAALIQHILSWPTPETAGKEVPK